MVVSSTVLVVCALISVFLVPDTRQQQSSEKNIAENEFSDKFVLNNPKYMTFDDDDYFAVDSTQMELSSLSFGGINIKNEAEKIGITLKQMYAAEAGVQQIQKTYDELSNTNIDSQQYAKAKLDKLFDTIASKFDRYLTVLKTSKMRIENLYSQHLRYPVTIKYECCNAPSADLTWEDSYRTKINNQTSCDLIPSASVLFAFNPGRNLTEIFQHNVQYIPSIRWQYFMSMDGIINQFPTHNYASLSFSDCMDMHNTVHRDAFIWTVAPKTKNIVIVMDHGCALTSNQLQTAKAIVKHIVNSLSATDRVGLLSLSSEVTFPKMCQLRQLVPVTADVKSLFNAFVEGLKKDEECTNHTLGFQRALQVLYKSLDVDSTFCPTEYAQLIYVSRGWTLLTEAKDVLAVIAQENGRMCHRIMINTYTLVDDGKLSGMIEKPFMTDVANQDFLRYNIQPQYPSPVIKGQMLTVSGPRDLISNVGRFYESFNMTYRSSVRVSLPFRDSISKDILLSLTLPCIYDGVIIGVAGIDIALADVVDGITYYSSADGSYVFLMNSNGIMITHPALQSYVTSSGPVGVYDVSQLEPSLHSVRLRTRFLRDAEGEETAELPVPAGNGSYSTPVKSIRYIWRHVIINDAGIVTRNASTESEYFVLVIRMPIRNADVHELDATIDAADSELRYHRLDLFPVNNMCQYMRQWSTFDTSTLFLSAKAFVRPYEHLGQEETKKFIQGYMAYLKDNTKLINYLRIREEVRRDVTVVAKLNKNWVDKHKLSHWSKYIVRRYVATSNGVYYVFPGTLINKTYDPTSTPWYYGAVDKPGMMIVTEPYLDTGGGGYVVTLSQGVYEGQLSGRHNTDDRVVGVIGIDVNIGFLYKIMLSQMPICEKENIRCFLMNDHGYLVAHGSLFETTGKGPLEQEHITHLEELVANDLLGHKGFVNKKLCNSLGDRTAQRYYQFNISIDGVITNLVHGEHCHSYQLALIPGTNMFLGIVNQTCLLRAFCPCSMVDRTCLNCNRMEQNECECPCECAQDMMCAGFVNGLLNNCEPRYPVTSYSAAIPADQQVILPECTRVDCNTFSSKLDCLGVVDCEWCTFDSDGHSSLKQPFCTNQKNCFAGVLGALSPYDSSVAIKAAPRQESPLTFKTASVGPVAGGILGCFLLIALVIYCYRQHMHASRNQYTAASGDQDNNCHIENEYDDFNAADDFMSGHTNTMALVPYESVSPYRMNTTYRRPTNAESDHGYSTMSPPADDSEQASTTCADLSISGRERPVNRGQPSWRSRSPVSHAASSCISSGGDTTASSEPAASIMCNVQPSRRLLCDTTVLSPTPKATTVLPTSAAHGNRFNATVQVHMVDTF